MSFFVAAVEHHTRRVLAWFTDSALYRFGWCYERSDDLAEVARVKFVEREAEVDHLEPHEPSVDCCTFHEPAYFDYDNDPMYEAASHRVEMDDVPAGPTPSDFCICGHTQYVHGPKGCDVDDHYQSPPCYCPKFRLAPSSPSSTIPPAQVDDEDSRAVSDIPPVARPGVPTVPAEVLDPTMTRVPSAGLENQISTAWRNGWYACELRHNIHPNQAERTTK